MKKNNLEITINFIEEYLTQNKEVFLPNIEPKAVSCEKYFFLEYSCNILFNYYHGEKKCCRKFITKVSNDIPDSYISDLKMMRKCELETLMTQVSILCHAYRWSSMPAKKELYKIKEINLPKKLDELWTKLSNLLNSPKVGTFYYMISNNWIYKKKEEEYNSNNIKLDNVKMKFNWLGLPQKDELEKFVITALYMEAQGKKILNSILKIYLGIFNKNDKFKIEGFKELHTSTINIVENFNKNIKKTFINPTNFLTHIQPTMIWLIDGLEGANGTQSCTVQLIDSFLQVEKNTKIGNMLFASREYLLPEHKELLNMIENIDINIKDVIKNENEEVKNLYNRTIKEVLKWRESHKIRGAKYLKGEKDNDISHYTSSGLAVKLNMERDEAFKELMQSHIEKTKLKKIKS